MDNDETWTDGGLYRIAGQTVATERRRTLDYDGTPYYDVRAYLDGEWREVGTWVNRPPHASEVAVKISLARK